MNEWMSQQTYEEGVLLCFADEKTKACKGQGICQDPVNHQLETVRFQILKHDNIHPCSISLIRKLSDMHRTS